MQRIYRALWYSLDGLATAYRVESAFRQEVWLAIALAAVGIALPVSATQIVSSAWISHPWGPVMPATECTQVIEATKGWNGYFLVSDAGTMSYRTRIRTPSFVHLQMIPLISRGFMIADLIAIIASIDFVMADVDR